MVFLTIIALYQIAIEHFYTNTFLSGVSCSVLITKIVNVLGVRSRVNRLSLIIRLIIRTYFPVPLKEAEGTALKYQTFGILELSK